MTKKKFISNYSLSLGILILVFLTASGHLSKDNNSLSDTKIKRIPISQSFFQNNVDTFLICEDYDLKGTTISIPNSSTLIFNGGSFSGGNIVFNNTTILGNPILLVNVDGTISNKVISIDWFLDNNDVYQLFERGVYRVADHHILSFSTKDYVMSSLLDARNDLELHDVIFEGNNCTITASDDKNILHSIIPLDMSSDIVIRNLTLDGNASIINNKAGGSRHNIRIARVKNLLLENVVSMNAFTDGFYINGAENVFIKSCTASHNGRQGLSITNCKSTKIQNCTFDGSYRTAPMSGVDIEPNDPQTDGIDVSFVNCRFINNGSCGFIVSFHEGTTIGAKKIVTVDSCYFNNNMSGLVLQSAERSGSGLVSINNSVVENTKHVPLSTNWAEYNTPQVSISNVVLHNGNLDDNNATRQLCSINANKRNTGNINIDGLRIIQAPQYAKMVNYGIYLHSFNGRISNITLKNLDIDLNRPNSISSGVYDIRDNAQFGDNIQIEYENDNIMVLSSSAHVKRDKGLLSNYALLKGVNLDLHSSINLDVRPSIVRFTVPTGSSMTNVFSSKYPIRYLNGKQYSKSDLFESNFWVERKGKEYFIHL